MKNVLFLVALCMALILFSIGAHAREYRVTVSNGSSEYTWTYNVGGWPSAKWEAEGYMRDRSSYSGYKVTKVVEKQDDNELVEVWPVNRKGAVKDTTKDTTKDTNKSNEKKNKPENKVYIWKVWGKRLVKQSDKSVWYGHVVKVKSGSEESAKKSANDYMKKKGEIFKATSAEIVQ